MKLDVYLQLPDGREVLAGGVEDVARAHRARTVSFSYAAAYLVEPLAYPLAPALPLTRGEFFPVGRRTMLPGLADAQPDAWGRALIAAGRRDDARKAGTAPRAATEVEILAAVSDLTRQGALRFTGAGDQLRVAPRAISEIPEVMELAALIDAARRFEAGEEVPDNLKRLLAAGTSAGGARPKANVRMPNGRLALAKLPREGDFGDAMAWEATALHLARLAGVEVPHFRLERPGDRAVLLLDRFDRGDDGVRMGYLSANSLLNKEPQENTTYVDLAEAVAPQSSERGDLEQLFRRIAVTLLVNNVDDHMKNHGMLRDGSGWSLSPAFDVNPFYRHGSVESTPISDRDDPADRDIRVLIEEADAFDLSREAAEQLVVDAEQATAGWREIAQLYGITPEGAEAMRRAFENPNRHRVQELAASAATARPAKKRDRRQRFPELFDERADGNKPDEPQLG
jgi:serine/threonine-protein kinase HipA